MPRTLPIANAINTWPKLAMFKPPSFAAVQNSLQLKILQRGGALGDAQIGWPSRLPCDLIVAMLKNDRDGRRRGFRISLGGRAQQARPRLSLSGSIGHHWGGSWPAGTSLLSARDRPGRRPAFFDSRLPECDHNHRSTASTP